MTPLIAFLIGYAFGFVTAFVIGFHYARERAWRISDRASRIWPGHVPPRPLPLPPKHELEN